MIPSSFEGFPLAGLEAAAAGVPVVACDIAGAKEFIGASGDGMTFTEGNVAEAIVCIEQIVLRKSEIIKSGQEFARESSLEKYAERLEMLFRSAL